MTKNYISLILKDLVILPTEEIKLEFNNRKTLNILDTSIKDLNSELIIITPKNTLEKSPSLSDLNDIGILVKIKKSLILPNGNIRVIFTGIKKVLIKNIALNNGFILCQTDNIKQTKYDIDIETTLLNKIKKLLKKYIESNSEISNSILSIVKDIKSIGKLVDMTAVGISLDRESKLKLFFELDEIKRAKLLIRLLTSKIKETDLDKEINEELRNKFNQSEQDIFIREKIKLLNSKLNYHDDKLNDIDNYYNKLDSYKLSDKTYNNIKREIEKLEATLDSSPEYGIIRSHLDFILNLPWNTKSEDNTDIKAIDTQLNKLHYGLEAVKTRIEEYLILKKENTTLKSPVICLVGPPGTGKTTFARELASSIGREFIKLSVGGLNDPSELIGHRRTYIGAGPGKIMDGIRKVKANNPVILIDEVDKIIKDYKGDPASTLLDILDSNQNKFFIDNYVGEEFDLSNVIFILTANEKSLIPSALYDRLEIVDVNSYTLFDKLNIAKKYSMPRFGAEYDFDYRKIHLSDRVLTKIINEYTYEAGVRELERNIEKIIRKVLIKGLKKDVIIKEVNLKEYLGNPKIAKIKNEYNNPGIVNIPACTYIGGTIVNVECINYPGNEIRITGMIKETMLESIYIALDYLKANSEKFNIDYKKFNSSFHIHATNSASPKNGPSGGVGITAALLSLILNKKIPNDIAFTGEMSLNGNILKIGGLKEKVISCYNNNIEKLYIPMDNIENLNEIPSKILKNVEIIPIQNFTEVYNDLFN